MYLKFMYSLKLLSYVWIIICYILTSVSHTADTSGGLQDSPLGLNSLLDTPDPSLPVIDDERKELDVEDASNTMSNENGDVVMETKVGLENSQQPVDETDPVETDSGAKEPVTHEGDDTDFLDGFLQLPTMDEFITQNTNGASNPDSVPIASFSDSVQTANTPSSTNSLEQNTNKHETPPKQKNYASADCGAKIVAGNPESRNTGGILNENRDDYMLNKCSLESRWVTVELCDYIQVLSIELSVHELFSSLPKNFTMSLSLQGGVKQEDWLPPTLFTAKNVRGDQVFRVPTAEQHHARFVKLNFVSHYGSEHYCPITTLRVFGANYVEVLEAIERGSGTQVPPVETSLHLDSSESEAELESMQLQEGEEKEGFFVNALDGLYKYVWPDGEHDPSLSIVNITHNTSDNTMDTHEDVNQLFIARNDSSPEVNLTTSDNIEKEIVVGLADSSNVTKQLDVSNETSELSDQTFESRDPVNEVQQLDLEPEVPEHADEDSNSKIAQENNNNNNNEDNPDLIDTQFKPKENITMTDDTVTLETDDPQSYAKIDLSQTQPTEPTPATADNYPEIPENTSHNLNASTVNTTQTADNNTADPVSTSPKEPPILTTPPTSQNYLVRMQERIARLGENVTLIHRYLDQFRHSIQRNVNRTEEVQRNLERKLSQLEHLVNLTLLNSYIQSEEFENSKEYWTGLLADLASDVQPMKVQFFLYFLSTLLIIVIIVAISIRQYNKLLREEINSLSRQFTCEIQNLSNIIKEDRNKLRRNASNPLRPTAIRNQDYDYFEVTDQGVLSDSNLNTYNNHTAKKKKKTRKNSNVVLTYP